MHWILLFPQFRKETVIENKDNESTSLRRRENPYFIALWTFSEAIHLILGSNMTGQPRHKNGNVAIFSS